MDAAVWHPTTFSKNRDRLVAGQIAEAFFAGVLRQAGSRALLSHEHFTVDGTLLEAWASQKSFRPTEGPSSGGDDDPGNPTVSFRGQRRSNATHRSGTDPDARLAKKSVGKEAKLSYQASVLLDNRHGLVVATTVSAPSGTAEVEQAIELCATRRPAPAGAPWGPTRGTISGASSPASGRWAGPRISPSVPAASWTAAPRGTRATPRAKRAASEWRKVSAGARRWGSSASCGSEAGSWSIGSSPSRWPRTTWSDSARCWPWSSRRERALARARRGPSETASRAPRTPSHRQQGNAVTNRSYFSSLLVVNVRAAFPLAR